MSSPRLSTQLPKVADLHNPLRTRPASHKADQKLDTAVDAAYEPSGGKKPALPTPNE